MRGTVRILGSIALSMSIYAHAEARCNVPLQRSHQLLFASVWIGEHGPFRFLFDTGATQTVIRPAVAKRVSATSSGTTVALSTSGPVEVRRATTRDLRIGALSVSSVNVLVFDFGRLERHGRVDGILGMDVLRGRSFAMDLPKSCIAIDVDEPAGSRFESTELAGRVAFRNAGLTFVIDSAASVVALMSPRARSLMRGDGTMFVSTAAGRKEHRSGTIDRMTFGDIAVSNAPAAAGFHYDGREDVLLPVTLFSRVWVSADRRTAVLE